MAAFAELPDDVLSNIAQWTASDGRGLAESSKRLLKAVRAYCRSLRLSGEDGLALTQLPQDRAFTGIQRLRYDLTCGHLTAPAAIAALGLAADRYPGLSHVSLVSHEAPEDADPLLLGAWRSSIQGLAPLVEQLLVLQRCRALVSLHLTFAGKMVAALVPLRSLTGLTQLRLTGQLRQRIFLRDLTCIKPLRLMDLALDSILVLDMDMVELAEAASPYPETLTRLELSRSRRTGEHLPSLAACPQLRTLDICYGGGVEYPSHDRLDRCLSQHGSCLQQLATLHVRRYDPKETVDFSLAANMDMWAVGSFLPSEVTALTSLTRLSATDWGYYVYNSCWKDLGTLPQLQVITGAVCCDWAPLVVSLPALQNMTCRVVYRPLTPELLLPLLLRALPALRQLDVVLESPPLPPVLKSSHTLDDPDFDQLPLQQRVRVQQSLARDLIDHLQGTEAEEQADQMLELLLNGLLAPEEQQLAINTQLCQMLHGVLHAMACYNLAQRPATAVHLTRLVMRCCCGPSRAPRMVASCKALPGLVPALQQLELTFPLQPELVPGLLEVVACLTQLTSLALTAEAWLPAPEPAAGDAPGAAAAAVVGPEGAADAPMADADNDGGAAAEAAAGPSGQAEGDASVQEQQAAGPSGAASQQGVGSSGLLQAAYAAVAAVTLIRDLLSGWLRSVLSGWRPLQQEGGQQPGPLRLPLPPPGAAVTSDAQGGCMVSATALAVAVVPLQQLQVFSIRGFPGACPQQLAVLLSPHMPRLRKVQHSGCAVVGSGGAVSMGSAALLLEAIVT